jgi:hypothetical protein
MRTLLPGDYLMGLRQAVSELVTITKDTFGFGPGFSDAAAARRFKCTDELDRLQREIEEIQKACAAQDQRIAKLQAALAITGDMVADESAYYIRKDGVLDGPFCTSCFQRNHEIARIERTPAPSGADQRSANWVQCVKCRTPFQSDRISQNLNPSPTAAAQTPASPGEAAQAKPAKAPPKPRTRSRRKKSDACLEN